MQPLTERGIEQARALGRTKWMRETQFDRYYTSDLYRAVRTANIVLKEASPADATTVVLERRLREMGKGAKEGFAKSISYDEAVRLRQSTDSTNAELPLKETEDEAWNRIYAFIRELIQEETKRRSNEDGRGTQSHPSNIFLMSHSGITRVFLRRLLGEKRLYSHSSAKFDKSGLFYIPNTSVTILDVGLRGIDDDTCDEREPVPYHDLDVDIVELTWAEHLGVANAESAYAE